MHACTRTLQVRSPPHLGEDAPLVPYMVLEDISDRDRHGHGHAPHQQPRRRKRRLQDDSSHAQQRPSVLDVKMGRATHGPFASPGKAARERGKYPHQTSVGFRIIGMKVRASPRRSAWLGPCVTQAMRFTTACPAATTGVRPRHAPVRDGGEGIRPGPAARGCGRRPGPLLLAPWRRRGGGKGQDGGGDGGGGAGFLHRAAGGPPRLVPT